MADLKVIEISLSSYNSMLDEDIKKWYSFFADLSSLLYHFYSILSRKKNYEEKNIFIVSYLAILFTKMLYNPNELTLGDIELVENNINRFLPVIKKDLSYTYSFTK